MRWLILIVALLVDACRSTEHVHETDTHSTESRQHVQLVPAPDDMITISGGRFLGRERNCLVGTSQRTHPQDGAWPEPVPLDVRGFSIDRVIVSCFEFDRCTESGRCSASHRLVEHPPDGGVRCVRTGAVVTRSMAAQYCAWRGARLPTYEEWQRAARGVNGDIFPGQGEDAPHFTSREGMEYSFALAAQEWLRDDDCWWREKDSEQVTNRPTSVDLEGPRLNELSANYADLAFFRCVRDDATGDAKSR